MSVSEADFLTEKQLLESVDEFLEICPYRDTCGRQLMELCQLRSHLYSISNTRIMKRPENVRAILLYVISILKRRAIQRKATSLHDLHCLVFDQNQIQRHNNLSVTHSALRAYFSNSQHFCDILNNHTLIFDSGAAGKFDFIQNCKEDQIGLIGHYNKELNVYLPLNYQENVLEEMIPTELEASAEKLCVRFVDRLIKNRLNLNIRGVVEFCSSRPHFYLVNHDERTISMTARENRDKILPYFDNKIKTTQANLIKSIFSRPALSMYSFHNATMNLDTQLEKSVLEFLDEKLKSSTEGVKIEQPLLDFYSQRSHRYEVSPTEGSVILRSNSGQTLMMNIIKSVAIKKKNDVSDLYDFLLNETEDLQHDIVKSFLCDVNELEALLGLHEHTFRKCTVNSVTQIKVTGWLDNQLNIFLPFSKNGSKQLQSIQHFVPTHHEGNNPFEKAVNLVQPFGFNKFLEFSRVKPIEQWMSDVRRGYEPKYYTVRRGHFCSPLTDSTYELEGLMFATLTPRGAAVTKSPSGDTKLVLPTNYLLPANQGSRLYFADFFCPNGLHKNRRYSVEHRVLLMITRRGSHADQLCQHSMAIELDKESNEFLMVRDRGGGFEYFTRAHVWIDVFFTENVQVMKQNLKDVEWVESHPRDNDLCEYCPID